LNADDRINDKIVLGATDPAVLANSLVSHDLQRLGEMIMNTRL